MPPSNACPALTVMGAEVDTAPDEAGRVVVTPVGAGPPPPGGLVVVVGSVVGPGPPGVV